MSEIEEERAVVFCDKRKADIDKWENKDTRKNRISVAYWYWVGKEKLRVFKAADTLVEAVKACQEAEDQIKAGQDHSNSNATLATS